MALDVTLGGENSNSYISVTDADTYFANHYSSASSTAWAALTSAQKEAALKRACQIVDSLNFLDDQFSAGRLPLPLLWDRETDITLRRYYSDQRLQFPRNVDYDSEGEVFIQQNVKDAQCEQAIYLLSFDPTNLTSRLTGVKYERVKAGNVEVEQSFVNGGITDTALHLAPMAIELLGEFIRNSKRMHRA